MCATGEGSGKVAVLLLQLCPCPEFFFEFRSQIGPIRFAMQTGHFFQFSLAGFNASNVPDDLDYLLIFYWHK